MADDDMEISSEHGQEPSGAEDIDIDIDLSAGPPDDDYILEDAQSNAEILDNFQPGSSPAVNDDLMVDEENASYTMADDILDDSEDEHMEQGTITMSYSVIDHNGDETGEVTSYDTQQLNNQDSVEDVTAMWDHPADISAPAEADLVGVIQEKGRQASTELTQRHQTAGTHAESITGNHEKVVNTQAEQETSDGVENAAERQDDSESLKESLKLENAENPGFLSQNPNRAGSQSSQISQASEEIGNLSEVQGLEEKLQSPIDTSNATENEALLEPATDEPISNAGGVASRPASQQVVIIYQSMEYALFSTSDSEDPDSFFLSDTSICDKPIADLFAALREIIVEDLAEEDELCMAIEDLGLEMDETSASIKSVTLKQIVGLRESLMKNDGIQMPEPLVILLGNRPNFKARLATLSSAAAAGKGLTEFLAWEAHGGFQGEVSDFDDGNYEIESQDGDELPSTTEAENSENKDEVNVEERITSTSEIEDQANPENTDSVADHEEDAIADDDFLPKEETPESRNTFVEDTALQPTELSQTAEDEDGDLIDYEDELEASQTDQEADQTQISAALHDTTEVDGNNASDGSRENVGASNNDFEKQSYENDEELEHGAEDELAEVPEGDEQQYEGEPLERNTDGEHESAQDLDQPYGFVAPEDSPLQNELTYNEEVHDGDSILSNEDEQVRDSRLHLLEAGEDHEISHLENGSGDQDQAAIKKSTSNTSSLGTADTGESESVTVASANTLEPDEISYEEIDDNVYDEPKSAVLERKDSLFTNADEDDQDEIDYDDEDENQDLQLEAAPTPDKASVPPNGASAKRSRADVDVEDATALGSSEAKRIRS